MGGVINLKPDTNNLTAFPNYNYGAFIKSPGELGVTADVNGWGIDQISNNMGGLIDYIENVLITGEGSGNMGYSLSDPTQGKRPLGNAYFFSSGLKCMQDGNKVDAYMYMNNVPLGNIPLISSLAGGKDFKDLRGLLPGMFEDLEGFDPREFLTALEINESESCVYPILPVTNITEAGDNYDILNGKPRTYYENDPDTDTSGNRPMFLSYAKRIDPCLFKPDEYGNQVNKFTSKQCTQGFTNINPLPPNNISINNNDDNRNNLVNLPFEMPDDILIQIYFIALAILFLFILLKMLHK